MKNDYLFQTERLGLRNWRIDDVPEMTEISADPMVMEFFPATKTPKETEDFVRRMQQDFEEKGYCYFAVDKLEDGQFIGFIGLCDQTYEAPFTPGVDIGWRIKPGEWGKGYATEGAFACLKYAFEELKLETIYSVAPEVNVKSQHIMKKIGMRQTDTFDHPALLNNDRLRACALYEIRHSEFKSLSKFCSLCRKNRIF